MKPSPRPAPSLVARRPAAAVLPVCLVLAVLIAAPAGALPAADILSPEDYFGHVMGADRKLVSYDESLPYLEYLAGASERVALDRIGTSTLGRDLVMLRISTPYNLANSNKYKDISRQLHDPRELTPEAILALADSGKSVLMVTMSIHADEIMPSQAALEWAWRLASGGEGSAARFLEDVIVLLVPSLNPDGQVMVTDWYRRYVGSEYEGCDLPWLYHHYAGHDNNRDWFMLNLKETRAVNRVAYHEWFPQVLVDEHQMGMTGPRIFVPPYADPVSDRVHPLIYRGANLFGSAMSLRLEQARKSGVIYGYLFDAYWPGGTRSTPWWKNTVGILVETASCRVASPIYIDPGELTGGQKGLADYQAQINFPQPWPGGWWHPRDIVEYGLIASDAALETAARYRVDLLRNRAHMALDALNAAGRDVPHAYAIPVEQHDPGAAARMVDLLRENGLEAYRTTEHWEQEGHVFEAGTVVFPTRQPLAAFLAEMMEPSDFRFVRVRPNSTEFFRPYDVTAWTLPLLVGVSVQALHDPVTASLAPLGEPAWRAHPAARSAPVPAGNRVTAALSPAETESYTAVLRLLKRGVTVRQTQHGFHYEGRSWPPGTFFVESAPEVLREALIGLRTAARAVDPASVEPVSSMIGAPNPEWQVRDLREPRVGLYQSWLPSMDEGWTRCVFDEFEVGYKTLHNDDIRRGNLHRAFDAIIMPDLDRDAILSGEGGINGDRSVPRPEPYSGGLDATGVRALVDFVREGGVLITLGQSSELALKDFNLPVQNEAGAGRGIGTPGTLLRVEVDPSHPLAFGMPVRAAVYHTTCPVFSTNLPAPGRNRTVVARYPASGDLVLSGWGSGTQLLRRKAALVEAEFGEGRVVLFGFRPQYRAQTVGTYRMLFNAVLDAAAR